MLCITDCLLRGIRVFIESSLRLRCIVSSQVFKDLWLHTDKYGRRLYGLGKEALIGTPLTSPKTFTLPSDFSFKSFTANSTLNHSSAYHLNTNGQMGLYGGEGDDGSRERGVGGYLIIFIRAKTSNLKLPRRTRNRNALDRPYPSLAWLLAR